MVSFNKSLIDTWFTMFGQKPFLSNMIIETNIGSAESVPNQKKAISKVIENEIEALDAMT